MRTLNEVSEGSAVGRGRSWRELAWQWLQAANWLLERALEADIETGV